MLSYAVRATLPERGWSDKRNSLSRRGPYGMLRHDNVSRPVRNHNPIHMTQ